MMRLSDLTAYAAEKFHITEEYKWDDFPGYSVLVTPGSGKWAALLIRRPDPVSGTETERCDIKCGREVLSRLTEPYLSLPFRMHGSKWVGVSFDSRTDPAVVRRLFDRAVTAGEQQGAAFVLEHQSLHPADYQETALPFRSRPVTPHEVRDDGVPAKIREMIDLYEFGEDTFRQKCRNFMVQGTFMKDYEDDAPWDGPFLHYFPTYHDLNIRQLRGYFTWRTKLRRGEFQPICSSLAYIYLYELLNGIGADTVEERLSKMSTFEEGYLDRGMGDRNMRRNLRRWMLELCIVHGLPRETALRYAEPEMIRNDEALAVLKDPKDRTDREIFDALIYFCGPRTAGSPVLKKHGDAGMHLFAETWRTASANYRGMGRSLFAACFGYRKSYSWHPFGNAVRWDNRPTGSTEYQLDPCRRYYYKDGEWWEQCWQRIGMDKKMPDGLLHEADRRFRLYLKTGSPLVKRTDEQWAAPYIDAVIEEDRRAKNEAAKPKVTIRFGDLDRIRRDSLETRDRLLTEEDLPEPVIPVPDPEPEEEPAAARSTAGIPLEAEQILLLRTLLEGRSVREMIRENHGMPSVAADALNEALFDEIGDSAVECEGDELTLVEDYRDDIIRILGGK